MNQLNKSTVASPVGVCTPAAIWVLGFVSLLMDISSDLIQPASVSTKARSHLIRPYSKESARADVGLINRVCVRSYLNAA
jgi:hypothetical protein